MRPLPPWVGTDVRDLLEKIFQKNPERRITAQSILKFNYCKIEAINIQ